MLSVPSSVQKAFVHSSPQKLCPLINNAHRLLSQCHKSGLKHSASRASTNSQYISCSSELSSSITSSLCILMVYTLNNNATSEHRRQFRIQDLQTSAALESPAPVLIESSKPFSPEKTMQGEILAGLGSSICSIFAKEQKIWKVSNKGFSETLTFNSLLDIKFKDSHSI